ncbi:hypothetical protein HPB49_008485 [Dermacentor silvarum]|uniref:Uncharacterized protein n=1 Tax=Dermacentor silvarum TaxID=543639 RepID=A0ACB8DBP3_DERSI|nr:hypothetical protein HPB49_008485 [Dermacentor silvarum]
MNSMKTSSDDSCCLAKTGESNSCDSLFERLFSAVSCVSLPQPSWAAHLINLAGVRDVVFIDAAVVHGTCDGSSVLFNRKILHVKSNMEVQVYVLDKLIDSAAVGVSPFATSALEVESMLKVVDGIDVCRGGPSLKDFPDVSPEYAFVDCQKSWRHNKCLLVTPGGAVACVLASLTPLEYMLIAELREPSREYLSSVSGYRWCLPNNRSFLLCGMQDQHFNGHEHDWPGATSCYWGSCKQR